VDIKKDFGLTPSVELCFLKAAVNEVGAYIFTKDLDGCYTFANNHVVSLFGIPLEQIIGKDDSHFFNLSMSSDLQLNDRRVMDHGETIQSEETNILKPSNETRIYWSIKKPVYDENSCIIGMCGVSTDITERKRMESKIGEQKELLDCILNNIDANVYMKDTLRKFRYVNSKAAELLGHEAEEIIGKTDTEVLSQEIADHFWQSDKKVFDSNQKHSSAESLLSPSGEKRHYWSIKVPFKLENGDQTLISFSTDITELYNLKQQLQRQAITDSLTGLYNRRYFYDQANREFARSKRQQQPLSLLVIDIDLFKVINDKYGHPVGDAVLSSIAANLLPLIREDDILARVGGEEFAILLPNTLIDSAINLAERIRYFQEASKVTGNSGHVINNTISIGVAISHSDDSDFQQVFLRADNALYQAKKQGRNRVIAE
jgi:diguanylate cyclase (GGDEF)-like protein/PAS domain S-box-containing protein